MIAEPLRVTFTRTGGGLPELRAVVPDIDLSGDDQRTWLGPEPPIARRMGGRPVADDRQPGYTVEFRRGGERRVVRLTPNDLTAHTRPLVDRLIRIAEGR